MAGIHGKNASIRVSTSETVISGVEMTTSPTPFTPGGVFQVSAGNRDWKYDNDVLVQFTTGDEQGGDGAAITTHSLTTTAGTTYQGINTQTRLINYAGGAIHMGQHPSVVSGVYAMATSMELSQVANLVGDARSFTVSVANDTVDSTVIGDSWKSFEDGLAGFEGSLDGLVVDEFWYKRSVSTLSGLLPRTVCRFQIDPKDATSYYQGTVIFPSFELTGGFDALVEYSVPFQGRGPLDLIDGGAPFFKVHETS
jgi:predicted secreted protein